MGVVIHLIAKSAVDLAWDDYQRLVLAEQATPALQHDRAHVERRILAHDRFMRLFIDGERR